MSYLHLVLLIASFPNSEYSFSSFLSPFLPSLFSSFLSLSFFFLCMSYTFWLKIRQYMWDNNKLIIFKPGKEHTSSA